MKAVRFVTVLALFMILLLALVLSACGSGGSSQEEEKEGAPSSEEEKKEDEKKEAVEGKKKEEKKEEAKKGEAKDLPKSAAGGQPGPGGESAISGAGVPEGGDFDRKVIKTAELGIRAENVRDSASEAQQITARLGGDILSSELNQGGGSVSADLVLTVPSERFEEALDELRELGTEVTTDTVEGEDVTEEYVDLQARERNLLAAEQSLVELYDQSESVQDTLAIQRELTGVRGEIERVQGRIEYLEQRTDFSQITLGIQPAVGATESRPAWDPAGVVDRAWDASLRVLQALATALISVVVFGWWLVPVLVVGLVLLWRWRKRRGSGKDTTQAP